MINRNFWT